MNLHIGQMVEWKLKDGRILKGVVGGYASDGARLEDVTIIFPDGSTSIARVVGVAFKDIVIEEEKSEAEKVEAEPGIEAEVKPKRGGRRRKE